MKKFLWILGLAASFIFIAPPLASIVDQVVFRVGEGRFVSQAQAGQISRTWHLPRFVGGRLICAVNTVNFLNVNGRHVARTRSSKAFLHYRRIARSHAGMGDVRFNFRRGGGHVQPVTRRVRGVLMCLNPSSRHQRWVERACPAGGIFVRV